MRDTLYFKHRASVSEWCFQNSDAPYKEVCTAVALLMGEKRAVYIKSTFMDRLKGLFKREHPGWIVKC